MKLITPEFDSNTGTWFYNGKEAKLISELLSKLGKGFQVEDYFPNGFPHNLTRRGKLFEDSSVIADNGVAPVTKHNGTHNKSLLETLEKLGPITEELAPMPDPVPEPVVIGKPITEPKMVGKPAKVYNKGFHPRDPNKDAILDMWRDGINTKIIAEKFNTSVKTIGRRVSDWRTAGDPRAVIRDPRQAGKPKSVRCGFPK